MWQRFEHRRSTQTSAQDQPAQIGMGIFGLVLLVGITWYFGLPASSSHTLIGSIIGVGIANQLMSVKTGTSGVDWDKPPTLESPCCSRLSSGSFALRCC